MQYDILQSPNTLHFKGTRDCVYQNGEGTKTFEWGVSIPTFSYENFQKLIPIHYGVSAILGLFIELKKLFLQFCGKI